MVPRGDVGLITESVYGQLIMLKIAIASVMVALGGFSNLEVQKTAEKITTLEKLMFTEN